MKGYGKIDKNEIECTSREDACKKANKHMLDLVKKHPKDKKLLDSVECKQGCFIISRDNKPQAYYTWDK